MRKRPAPEVVASVVSAVEPEPKRSAPSATEASPVPPPAVFSVPEVLGVRVNVPDELVMLVPSVSPLNDWVEVAKVMGPVCAVPNDCASEVTPVAVLRQTPLIAKQPPERSTPLSVDVAVALKRVARTPKANDDVAVVEVEVM